MEMHYLGDRTHGVLKTLLYRVLLWHNNDWNLGVSAKMLVALLARN